MFATKKNETCFTGVKKPMVDIKFLTQFLKNEFKMSSRNRQFNGVNY